MSSRRRRDQRGFSLLECEIAGFLLVLLLMGFMHLNGGHEQLVSEIEDWTAGGPVYYVDPSDDAWERILGKPAELVAADPGPEPPPPAPDAYEVHVLTRSATLHPPTVTATCLLVEP